MKKEVQRSFNHGFKSGSNTRRSNTHLIKGCSQKRHQTPSLVPLFEEPCGELYCTEIPNVNLHGIITGC